MQTAARNPFERSTTNCSPVPCTSGSVNPVEGEENLFPHSEVESAVVGSCSYLNNTILSIVICVSFCTGKFHFFSWYPYTQFFDHEKVTGYKNIGFSGAYV